MLLSFRMDKKLLFWCLPSFLSAMPSRFGVKQLDDAFVVVLAHLGHYSHERQFHARFGILAL